MNTYNNYRIRIEEWKYAPEIGIVPETKKRYLIQKKYLVDSLFERLFFKNEWVTIGESKNLDEALIHMRNLHNADNPKIKYRYLE